MAAVFLALFSIVLLETAFRLFDVGTPAEYVDPFVGFSRTYPLFVKDEAAVEYHTAASRRLHFGEQQFPVQKPTTAFRAFCLGGSTVHGRPYQPDTAFPKWLDIELQQTDKSQAVEMINCGGISYASYRLVPILEEVLDYSPDLIVVATGHNEFLEDRTYQTIKSRSPTRAWLEERVYSLRTMTLARRLLDAARSNVRETDTRPVLPDEVEARLDSRSGYASYHRDEEWRRQVISHFEQSIRGMVRLCADAGVPLVLVNLGCNLRDCPPFKSELDTELRPDRESEWQAAFDTATAAEATDVDEALRSYRQAEQIDDHFALLDYRIAHCFDRLGQFEAARRYYLQAKEKDVCPLRILEAMHQVLTTVAHETNTPLVDANRMFEQLSPDALPGNNWYIDHVHPTIGGHQRIAQAIAVELRRSGIVADRGDWSDQQRRRAYRQHWKELSPAYFANGRKRVHWLESWARRERLSGDTLPKDARGFLRRGDRQLDFGDIDAAWADYQEALKQRPELAHQVLEHARELIRQGRPGLAQKLLDRLKRQSLSENISKLIVPAAFVAAVENADWQQARTLFAIHRDILKRMPSQLGEWTDLLPNALDRFRETPQTNPSSVSRE